MAKQEWTLPDLVLAVSAAAKTKIATPVYAQGKQLIVSKGRFSVAELLFALEELYGWTLRYDEKRGYTFGRPVYRAAANAVELKAMLASATPPPVRHLLWDTAKLIERQHFQVGVLMESVTRRFKGELSRVAITDLKPEEQDQLAVILFASYLYDEPSLFQDSQPLYYWLLTPEKGVFTWQDGRGKPRIVFSVEGPRGRTHRWGWIVGSGTPNR